MKVYWEDEYMEEVKEEYKNGVGKALILFLIVSLLLMLFLVKFAHAADYTDEQIVNAIYQAEGGDHAKYPYGIRSIKCGSRAECYRICRNTVKNNRQRFKQYGYKSHQDFISFIASRYCPIGVRNDPKNLNKNWLKNVLFYLKKDS